MEKHTFIHTETKITVWRNTHTVTHTHIFIQTQNTAWRNIYLHTHTCIMWRNTHIYIYIHTHTHTKKRNEEKKKEKRRRKVSFIHQQCQSRNHSSFVFFTFHRLHMLDVPHSPELPTANLTCHVINQYRTDEIQSEKGYILKVTLLCLKRCLHHVYFISQRPNPTYQDNQPPLGTLDSWLALCLPLPTTIKRLESVYLDRGCLRYYRLHNDKMVCESCSDFQHL